MTRGGGGGGPTTTGEYGAIKQLFVPPNTQNIIQQTNTAQPQPQPLLPAQQRLANHQQQFSLLLPTNLSERPLLLHRDSEFSVGSDYNDAEIHNNLKMWQAAVLLVAEMMGTGLLALPGDIQLLGKWIGLGFLLANLPINYYAGCIFHQTATAIEVQQQKENRVYKESRIALLYEERLGTKKDGDADADANEYDAINHPTINHETLHSIQSNFSAEEADALFALHSQIHHDTSTFDFIGICDAIFQTKLASRLTMSIYYTNILLVVANYILVAAHAVAALFGEDRICLPTAGLIATVGMVVVSQYRTMSRLGRVASIVSLGALFIVIVQCLWELHGVNGVEGVDANANENIEDDTRPFLSILRKLSALGSIGFACGSQKLFLNIRHELANRSDGPQSLGLSIAMFGTGYVAICMAAGPNPPSLLLDAIPLHTYNRHIAGFLLWIHVIVSYAINCQAICSSFDRLWWRKLANAFQSETLRTAGAATRWMVLTLSLAVIAYTGANAIPFFKDLVALIGSATAVPLTLLLPAIFWRKHLKLPLLTPLSTSTWRTYETSWGSLALTYFSIVFMVAATFGSLYSIREDWSNHGPPFSCQ